MPVDRVIEEDDVVGGNYHVSPPRNAQGVRWSCRAGGCGCRSRGGVDSSAATSATSTIVATSATAALLEAVDLPPHKAKQHLELGVAALRVVLKASTLEVLRDVALPVRIVDLVVRVGDRVTLLLQTSVRVPIIEE